jgi:hypothetical protein
MDKAEVVRLVIETVEGYRLAVKQPGARSGSDLDALGPDAKLFGRGGVLDSLGLVSVLVEIEQRIADAGAVTVSLMDDRAMSQTRSPFATVDSLAEYVMRQLGGEQTAG